MKRFARWGTPTVYDSMEGFLSQESLPDGPHALPRKIDLFSTIIPGAPLAFVFHGSIDRRKFTPPVFQGAKLISDFSRVSIADPSLHLAPNLQIAWYLGHRGLALQQLLVPILRRIVEIAKPSRLLFVGGSGGGFASLYYATHFPESIAVVWNPQTNVLLHWPQTVQRYAKMAWGVDEHSLPPRICTNVLPLYRKPGPKVIYLQNRSDDHLQLHLEPFLEACGDREGVLAHVGDWGEGHVPPPREFTTELIRRVGLDGFDAAPAVIEKADHLACISRSSQSSPQFAQA